VLNTLTHLQSEASAVCTKRKLYIILLTYIHGMNLGGNGPTSPSSSTSPVGSPTESPEGTITPSASDFPSASGINTMMSILN